MTIVFKPATKEAAKARIALTGPSGSGKTYSALMLAFGLGESVALVDTERGSASKYVGRNGWQFQTVQPNSYSPLSLVDTLGAAAGAGFDVLIIDSLSHYWMGTDGMLEQVDRRSGNNKFTSGWKVVGPEEKKMIDAILAYPGHIIVTLRTKTEYVLETNDRGKQEPKRVGLKPVQREGIEYEFDLIGDLDLDNRLIISKSRMEGVDPGTAISKPSVELAVKIVEFCSEGKPVAPVSEFRTRALALDTVDDLKALFQEAAEARLDGAPMLDDEGRPTVLGDFLRARATEIKNQLAGDA